MMEMFLGGIVGKIPVFDTIAVVLVVVEEPGLYETVEYDPGCCLHVSY